MGEPLVTKTSSSKIAARAGRTALIAAVTAVTAVTTPALAQVKAFP